MNIPEAVKELENLASTHSSDFKDCKDFLVHAYKLVGVTLPENLYSNDIGEASRKDFELVYPPYRAYDIAVFRSFTGEVRRHVGIMLDSRWLVHFLVPTIEGAKGQVARGEITRDQFCNSLVHVGRYKGFEHR